MKAISSWSGGKDSCLACWRAVQDGHDVAGLLNFISKEFKRCCFYGTEDRLIAQQSSLAGIPVFQVEVSADMEKYEEEFKAAVLEIKQDHGIEGMVFGDVYLDEHMEWVGRVCGDLGIEPIEPLWNRPAADVVREFINAGFKSVVVSCKEDLFGEDFVGRFVNEEFITDLQKRDICPCGENGEFHTLVVDGPLFEKKIEITKSRAVLKQGFWKYWFLDIQEWRVTDK